MHKSSYEHCKLFAENYVYPVFSEAKILEIGSQDINGSLRGLFESKYNFTGVDMVSGKGVDVVLEDPYKLPFLSDSYDVVVASSCFEHVPMFWTLFLEIIRVLNSGGVFYLQVPSNGYFHPSPVDCWRFYPDAALGLVDYAKLSGFQNCVLLESFTGLQYGGYEGDWNDFVAIFSKDYKEVLKYPRRIIDQYEKYVNARFFGGSKIKKFINKTEDQVVIAALKNHIAKK